MWVVAGCLFEVALPVVPGGSWRLAAPTDAVTLVADEVRGGAHHLRFRAEAAGAAAGGAELCLAAAGGATPLERRVAVRIAPERLEQTP